MLAGGREEQHELEVVDERSKRDEMLQCKETDWQRFLAGENKQHTSGREKLTTRIAQERGSENLAEGEESINNARGDKRDNGAKWGLAGEEMLVGHAAPVGLAGKRD